MGKLEKNMHKIGKFLTVTKKEGATITATTLRNQLPECN